MKRDTTPLNSLCWKCDRACGNLACSWVENQQPVDGWEIETRIISGKSQHKKFKQVSVKNCPLFVEDGELDIAQYRQGLRQHSPIMCRSHWGGYISKII